MAALMDMDLLAIILVSLLVGWLIGRFAASRGRERETQGSDCSGSYIQGLNYLLANQPDKAIDLFVDLIKVDGDTIETHLALGNLFRSKGEVDRAIKIHQNLVARPNLDTDQRQLALSELAADYMKAGLLDRAENLYRELLQIRPNNVEALRRLFDIYSTEKSWSDAVEIAQRLQQLKNPESRVLLTHSLCEQAQQAMEQGNLRNARELLKQALDTDEQSLRAQLLMVELLQRQGDLRGAAKRLSQAAQRLPEYAECYLEPARQLFNTRGDSDGQLRFLLELYERRPSPDVALEILTLYRGRNQHDELLDFLRQALRQPGSLQLLDFCFHYFKSPARAQQLQGFWPELTHYLETLNRQREAYRCQVCGYGARAMQWQCPSCNSWSSFKPA